MAKVFLVSNEHTKVGHNLSHFAITADNIHCAVAYLSTTKPVEDWLKRGVRVKLVVALNPPIDAGVLRYLVNSFPVHLEASLLFRTLPLETVHFVPRESADLRASRILKSYRRWHVLKS